MFGLVGGDGSTRRATRWETNVCNSTRSRAWSASASAAPRKAEMRAWAKTDLRKPGGYTENVGRPGGKPAPRELDRPVRRFLFAGKADETVFEQAVLRLIFNAASVEQQRIWFRLCIRELTQQVGSQEPFGIGAGGGEASLAVNRDTLGRDIDQQHVANPRGLGVPAVGEAAADFGFA